VRSHNLPSGIVEGIKRNMPVHLNILTVLPTATSLFQAQAKFCKIQFGDCSLRVVVHKVSSLLMVARLDGLEHGREVVWCVSCEEEGIINKPTPCKTC